MFEHKTESDNAFRGDSFSNLELNAAWSGL